jgi:hypothetical protein
VGFAVFIWVGSQTDRANHPLLDFLMTTFQVNERKKMKLLITAAAAAVASAGSNMNSRPYGTCAMTFSHKPAFLFLFMAAAETILPTI